MQIQQQPLARLHAFAQTLFTHSLDGLRTYKLWCPWGQKGADRGPPGNQCRCTHAASQSPVHTPGSVPVAQLVQVGRNFLHALECIDDNVVDDVAPQHDIAPGGDPLPFVGCAKPPGLQDIFQVAVLSLDGPSAVVAGQVLQDVGALTQLSELLEAGKKRNGGHDADLWHLPPPTSPTVFACM